MVAEPKQEAYEFENSKHLFFEIEKKTRPTVDAHTCTHMRPSNVTYDGQRDRMRIELCLIVTIAKTVTNVTN